MSVWLVFFFLTHVFKKKTKNKTLLLRCNNVFCLGFFLLVGHYPNVEYKLDGLGHIFVGGFPFSLSFFFNKGKLKSIYVNLWYRKIMGAGRGAMGSGKQNHFLPHQPGGRCRMDTSHIKLETRLSHRWLLLNRREQCTENKWYSLTLKVAIVTASWLDQFKYQKFAIISNILAINTSRHTSLTVSSDFTQKCVQKSVFSKITFLCLGHGYHHEYVCVFRQ